MVAANNVFPKRRLTEIWIGGIRLVCIKEISWQAWDNKRGEFEGMAREGGL